MGIWTEEMFVKMIWTGRHMGQSRPVLPPMSMFAHGHLTDDELKAIFAFLRTLPPITNRAAEPEIAPPQAGAPPG